MIPKTTIEYLYKDTFKRSTLIAIPNISELLVVPHSEFSKWEIFCQIVREALNKWEYYYPLERVQKIYIEVDYSSRIGKYFPNFESYLKGILDEDSITLEIMSCQGLAFNGYVNSQYPLRNFRFVNNQFTDMWYSTQVYWGNCLCKHPLVEDYLRVDGKQCTGFTDNCCIYFMSPNQDNTFTMFRDQVYVELCRYLVNIKQNFNLQNMPVDLFQGLENDFNRVDSELQNKYQQAYKGSGFLI
jgi:hypothetical protein